jgi:membrane-bound ClpP family serine protease
MRLSAHGPSARAEFRQTILRSLIGAAEAEVELRRSRHQRIRARRAERRLDGLQRQLSVLETGYPRSLANPWFRSLAAGRVVTLLWLVGAGLLAFEIAVDGVHSTKVIVGDAVMLVLSLVWFLLAVARVPISEPRGAESVQPE